jgi:hypothetical protein
MMDPQRTRDDWRRFTLPEDRTSSVRGPGAASDRDLRNCPCCGSALVQLLELRALDDGTRQVERRCPECEWHGGGRFTTQAVARYEHEQDAARASLEALLLSIEQARMERDVERFAHSLARDQVLPEDF